MKKIFYYISAAVLTYGLASCAREIDPVADNAEGQMTIEADVEDGLSKTTLYPDENEGYRVLWSKGDQILIVNDRTSEITVYTLSEGAGSTSGRFTGAALENGEYTAYYAFDPENPIAFGEQSNLSSEQISNAPMRALFTVAGGTVPTLKFVNACGLLRLRLHGNSSIKKIKIITDEGLVSHFANFKEDGSMGVQDPPMNPALRYINLDCGENGRTLVGDTTSFFIAMPPGEYNNVIITATDIHDAVCARVLVHKTLAIQRSKVTRAEFSTPEIDIHDLSAEGTANCYIVSAGGNYRINATKGNLNMPLGDIASAEVLWESFGTSQTPQVGALVSGVQYADGHISFHASDLKGNAVIAAKDASGKILWSWHIWMTDQPKEQVYLHDAGIMMDRNIGATSAIRGNDRAQGLLYQWGRKDPFLGSSSIVNPTIAKSTINWPSHIVSSPMCTIEYAIEHPTTFIQNRDADLNGNYDWYYTGSHTTDITRWNSGKGLYDPCPPGWRVPDGGGSGVWVKALGKGGTIYGPWDDTYKGMYFTEGTMSSTSDVWYPACGFIKRENGSFSRFKYAGEPREYEFDTGCWSCTHWAYCSFHSVTMTHYNGIIEPAGTVPHAANALSVRCIKMDVEKEYIDLSANETANCYIVPAFGKYKFKAVKGISDEPVDNIDKVTVYWETFGTDVAPEVGDLVFDCKLDTGYIKFGASSKKGNALIIAMDSNGTILWSWHIWLTDQPEEQVYFNNAGTMMDRNLGATSTKPSSVQALGLIYQWGRKDPFMGGSSIINEYSIYQKQAASAGGGFALVNSDEKIGTYAYATAHPYRIILGNSFNNDWFYTGDSSTDNTRWQTSDMPKGWQDPCPPGWRVPDGGPNGVWAKAFGSDVHGTWDDSGQGYNFSGILSAASMVWYPSSGYRTGLGEGDLRDVGKYGLIWSCTPYEINDAYFIEYNGAFISPECTGGNKRATCKAVRCIKQRPPTPVDGTNTGGYNVNPSDLIEDDWK